MDAAFTPNARLTSPPLGLYRFASSSGLLLAALALWLLATLGLRPLLLPDEGRYASVALEMLHGDGWLPTLNGLPFFHKPPLFYWLDMAAMHLFGVGPFSARVGSMLGGWLMGASMYLALRRWHGPRLALLALVVLATSPFFFVASQYANHDMLVAGLISAAIMALLRAVENPPTVDLRWLAVGAAACALATLAKGLIGFVLPAMVLGPWLLAQGRWRQVVGLLHPLGWLVFLLIAAPWFVAIQLRYPGFFDYFVVEQHFRRFAQSSFNNVQPLWFFLPVIPALMLPWAGWIPVAAVRAWRERTPMVDLYAWWIVAIVGFFSLPSSKLVGYVLPALVPVSIFIAMALELAPRRRIKAVAALSTVVCLAIVGAIAWQAPKSNRGAALALAQAMAPGDTVVMVDDYLYDLPFYARLRKPVVFASDWANPQLASQDNWRNELIDAARFAPERGDAVLRPMAQLDRMACDGHTVWFAVASAKAPTVAALTGVTRMYQDAKSELWRAGARSCS
ncbi:MAG: glycosyltransferase family 39 protein [Rhodoferax sp.]|nr:glycosyltransferase family 39 protein [Rhodoferax sp.]